MDSCKIHQILTNEKYIGNNIYNKTSSKLKSRLVKPKKNEWVRCDKAYKPIISKKKYNKAQEIIQLRSVHLTNEELLEKLKQKLESNGKLSFLSLMKMIQALHLLFTEPDLVVF